MGLFDSKKSNKPAEAPALEQAATSNTGVTVVSNNPNVPGVGQPEVMAANPAMADPGVISAGEISAQVTAGANTQVMDNTTLVSPEVNYNNTIPGSAGSMQPEYNNVPPAGGLCEAHHVQLRGLSGKPGCRRIRKEKEKTRKQIPLQHRLLCRTQKSKGLFSPAA